MSNEINNSPATVAITKDVETNVDRRVMRKCDLCEGIAAHAFCHDIVKHYPVDEGGNVGWLDGDIVFNEDDPLYLCNDCWCGMRKHDLWEHFI